MCKTNNTKNEKANDSSGVVFDMLKAGGETCLKSLIGAFNDILFESRLEGERMLSLLVAIFKGNRDPLKSKFVNGNKSVGACFQVL